jgi:arylsulfatase A-like enzyme
MYTDESLNDPELTLWPRYGPVRSDKETPDYDADKTALTERQIEFVQSQFAGKVTMVDEWFGKLLDKLDEQNTWDDTAIILTSDHGHYLGDHGWIGKPRCPVYDVLARTPLLIWHPDYRRTGGTVTELTSAVDLYATMLELLGIKPPKSTHSRSLVPLLDGKTSTHRNWALYGYWGTSINITDGRYTYLLPPEQDVPVPIHSTMMLNNHPDVLDAPRHRTEADAGVFLPYTDAMVWRYYEEPYSTRGSAPRLYDVEDDPVQEVNLVDDAPNEERRMRNGLYKTLEKMSAPTEHFERFNLD